MSPRVLFVVGARPNFVKVAPVWHAVQEDRRLRAELLHTGQHYDWVLSGSFLEHLGLPAPAHFLGVGSGTHAEQTAAVLVGAERVLATDPPDAVVVAGDVNSTLAAALAAAKAGASVIHLESGLRSGDWSMPEEVNRVVTDRLSDLLLCTSADAVENLRLEGVADDRIALVGNTMIDSLLKLLPGAEAGDVLARLGLRAGGYVLATLHRPSLVDDPSRLEEVLQALSELAQQVPVVFPMHPRTQRHAATAGLGAIQALDPLEYEDFIALEARARLVITDSGGVQEETSVLGVPCLTYRSTTERPITIDLGTNRLIGVDPTALLTAARSSLADAGPRERPQIPLWDGRAGARAARAIATFLLRTAPAGARETPVKEEDA